MKLHPLFDETDYPTPALLARVSAGDAPRSEQDAYDILESVRISFMDGKDLSEGDREEILQTVRRIVTAIRAEKQGDGDQ